MPDKGMFFCDNVAARSGKRTIRTDCQEFMEKRNLPASFCAMFLRKERIFRKPHPHHKIKNAHSLMDHELCSQAPCQSCSLKSSMLLKDCGENRMRESRQVRIPRGVNMPPRQARRSQRKARGRKVDDGVCGEIRLRFVSTLPASPASSLNSVRRISPQIGEGPLFAHTRKRLRRQLAQQPA